MSQSLPPAMVGGVQVTVTQIAPGTGPAPDGTYVRGKNVTFQLSSGHADTVFVPDKMWNEDYVRQAVMDAAARLNTIANLTFGV